MRIGRRELMLGSLAAGLATACSPSGSTGRTAPTPSTPATSPPGRTTAQATSAAPQARQIRRPSGPARQIAHGPRTAKAVALTFHTAGDPAVVRQIITTAHKEKAGLTMLVVGTWLEANPRFARDILAAGHDLGNHTWTHPVLPDDDPSQTHAEIARCAHLLHRLTGGPGSWFRPSGTPTADPLILQTAGAVGYPASLAYDVDPLDYTDPGASAVIERVLSEVRPGSIVSLHTLYEGTAEALPHIIRGLRKQGLTPVTTTQLLGRKWAA